MQTCNLCIAQLAVRQLTDQVIFAGTHGQDSARIGNVRIRSWIAISNTNTALDERIIFMSQHWDKAQQICVKCALAASPTHVARITLQSDAWCSDVLTARTISDNSAPQAMQKH